MEPNLVVTCDPSHELRARQEVEELLKGRKFSFLESDYKGVFLLHVNEDAKKLVSTLSKLCEEEPYRFAKTFRWTPIEEWCDANMEDMKAAAKEKGEKIGPRDTWKLDVSKRDYEGDSMELIRELTENIDKPHVDLKNPQKIIKVEIMGDRAGISLLSSDEYLNTTKAKM